MECLTAVSMSHWVRCGSGAGRGRTRLSRSVRWRCPGGQRERYRSACKNCAKAGAGLPSGPAVAGAPASTGETQERICSSAHIVFPISKIILSLLLLSIGRKVGKPLEVPLISLFQIPETLSNQARNGKLH